MSWGMNMSCPIKMEFSVSMSSWMFEIWLVNNRGWCGDHHYDDNSLQIVRYPSWLFRPEIKEQFSDREIERLRWSTGPQFYSIDRIENGELSNMDDIASYKEVIKRFRDLIVFI